MALSLIDVMLFPHLEEYPDDTKVQFPVYTVYVCLSGSGCYMFKFSFSLHSATLIVARMDVFIKIPIYF